MPGSSRLPPFQHRFVDTPDARIHYAELETSGKPLIMLHGIGMDWRVWQAVSRRLVPAFHLYLPDLRGHGQSSKPEHGYSIAHYAADIEDLIDRLGLEEAALAGSSLGGIVTVAAETPADVVTHRILVDPPLTGGPVRDAAMFEDILRLKHRPPHELAEYLLRLNPGAGRYLTSMMSEMWHHAADGVITDMLADREHYFDVTPALRATESPTLIMQADPSLGGVLRSEQAQSALALLPKGSLAYVEGSGHAIHATKPGQFAQLIHDFVETGDSTEQATA